MRKYECQKESKNLDAMLNEINRLGETLKAFRIMKTKNVLWRLKHKIRFYYCLFRVRFMIEQSKHYDLISENDSIKLKDMWRKILKRTY